jgi:HSP20 family protein
MAQLPARRTARNITLVDPSREFEDIYDRMGHDACLAEVELPGVNKDQVNVDVNDRELVITGEIAEPQEEEGRRRNVEISG